MQTGFNFCYQTVLVLQCKYTHFNLVQVHNHSTRLSISIVCIMENSHPLLRLNSSSTPNTIWSLKLNDPSSIKTSKLLDHQNVAAVPSLLIFGSPFTLVSRGDAYRLVRYCSISTVDSLNLPYCAI